MQINILKNRLSAFVDGNIIHQGFAFEIEPESFIYADTEFPEKLQPSGVQIIAYFLKIEDGTEIEPSILDRCEADFKERQPSATLDHFVGIIIQEGAIKNNKIYGYRKKENEITECEIVLIEDTIEAIALPFFNVSSDYWKGKRVLIAGCGSFGYALALELVNAGVSQLTLVDYSRLKKNEAHRTHSSLVNEGRKKNDLLKELLLTRRHTLKVTNLDLDISENPEILKSACKTVDLIVGLTDQRAIFNQINQIAFDLKKPMVLAISNSQASFGYIYRFDPNLKSSPCFNCMGVGQFSIRGNTIFYERNNTATTINSRQAYVREEALNLDLLPYIHMLTRVCLEFLSDGLVKAMPHVNVEDSALLLFPTGQYPFDKDPVENKNNFDYKKMCWYPVTIGCFPECTVCGNK